MQAPWQVNEELANKVAEITVLRQRMHQIERENLRLENELSQAKEKCSTASSSQKTREKAELERANEEIQYLRQDLAKFDDDRKRLKEMLQNQEQELLALRQREEDARFRLTQAAPTVETRAPVATRVAAPVAAPVAAQPAPAPSAPAPHEAFASSERAEEAKGQLLLRELVRWETLAEGSDVHAWYQLRAAMARFPAGAVAAAGAAARALRASSARPARCQGARVLRLWLGLFPTHAREIAAAGEEGLFGALSSALHRAMNEPDVDQGEILAFLLAFSEAASKLKGSELLPLKALPTATLCTLLSKEPRADGIDLRLPCLRLLEALMASPELFALAHQAESKENVLLVAADLLVLPSVAEGERDSLERQKCRVAALRLFSRCCATASLDFVLPLRAEEGMDTVLQSLVLLCHHELLCLLMYGNPWHSDELEESREQRLQAVELSLFLLASLAWQLSPFKDGLESATGPVLREALSFGRTHVLLPSIVDMVCGNELEEFEPFLSSISAIRLLIEEPAAS